MTDTPSWLTPEGGGAAAPAPAAPSAPDTFALNEGAPTTSTPSAPAATAGAAQAADDDLPGVILTMRLANMGVAVALIVCSVSLQMMRRHCRFPSPVQRVLASTCVLVSREF